MVIRPIRKLEDCQIPKMSPQIIEAQLFWILRPGLRWEDPVGMFRSSRFIQGPRAIILGV
jgi:hypothetical protein